MKRILLASLLSLLTLVPASAFKEDETTAEVVASAQAAKPDDQPKLYIKAAEMQLDTAKAWFDKNDDEHGLAAVSDVTVFSTKAADVSIQTGKRLKQTEIAIRKMAERLLDIKRLLGFESQPPVQKAIDQLEDLRTRLFDRMFGKSSRKKPKGAPEKK